MTGDPATTVNPPLGDHHAAQLRRVMVVGSAGSGKSTLARRLGANLDRPVYHLDTLFWLPGWEQRPEEEFRALQVALVESKHWIIDGNYRRSMDLRLPRADTVIMLDVPRRLALWRVVRRRWRYRGRSRPDLTPGCPEKIDLEFLRWIWRFPAHNRPDILARIAARPNLRLIHLQGRREVGRFLALLQREGAGADLASYVTSPAAVL